MILRATQRFFSTGGLTRHLQQLANQTTHASTKSSSEFTTSKKTANVRYGWVEIGERDAIPQPEDSPIWSCNEWDPLEAIIVGRPDNAVIAPLCTEAKSCLEPHKLPFYRENGGKYWRDVVGKERWDALVKASENYVKVLEVEGVKVERPDSFDFMIPYTTPTFGPFVGHDAAMARDHLMVVGNEIIESAMGWRYRYFEFIPFRKVIMKYWRDGGVWTMAPKPTLDPKVGLLDEGYTESMNIDERYNCVDRWVTSEAEPCWDAADFLRLGRDIIGQRSQATNLSGFEWVRRHLAPKGVRVHRLDIDEPFNLQIDILLNVLTPGVLMTNPEIKFKDLSMFEKAGWKFVEAPMPVDPDSSPVWKMTAAMNWIAINTVHLDPKRVLVEKRETEIIKMYEKHGVKVIPVSFSATQWLGGGLHCWSSDLRRRGPMQCYL